mgnify:CR=1 FL=1
MAIIFNSKECGITKEGRMLFYRYYLIECNVFTFTVATIPSWAMEEVKNLIGKDVKGTGLNYSLVSGSKKAIKLKNQYDHPTLYEKTMKCFTQEG